ncbi:MAG: SCO family protein [Verrucomicrobia bacterium]|nr:MAG: SCO family protein [Verrucomicrobiota bacterium]
MAPALFGAYAVSRFAANRNALPMLGNVSDFALTNQFGRVVTRADLLGQVWVADIIFTRCPGPCATMSKVMRELQDALPPNEPIQLVSLTADPEFDTPEVLKKYGEGLGAMPGHWQFLTGKKLEVYRLATRGLLLAVDEVKADERTSPEDLFVHSTLFVVVDKQGRIRGSFDGTEPASRRKILEVIRALLKEKQP